jgi:hypothetical protein
MKRTAMKSKLGLKLERRLELVRTTLRELTPAEMERVNGAYAAGAPTAGCGTNCGNVYSL